MMKQFLGWIIETWFPNDWVTKEDHVMIVESEITLAKLIAPARWQAVNDDLRRQNEKLICDGLHRYGFLPKDADSRGTVSVNATVKMQQRDRFKVTAEVEDMSIGYSDSGLRGVVFDQLAMLLAGILKGKLVERFKVAEEEPVEEEGELNACQ